MIARVRSLLELQSDQFLTVERVFDCARDRCTALGLVEGSRVRVAGRRRHDLLLRTADGRELECPRELARFIMASPADAGTDLAQVTSADELYDLLLQRLGGLIPEPELRRRSGLAAEISRLKVERGAVILGHNYMEPVLYHGVCDLVGDSLELSRLAVEVEGDPIVFCGVRFMAETAKILNPEKKVLLPTAGGGCSLAESITGADVRKLKRTYPGVPVVTYVNTYAEVKAETDICCTSGNAVQVVESLDSERVLFLPDQFLAANVARQTGRAFTLPARPDGASVEGANVPGPGIIGWRGRCEVHERFTVWDIEEARRRHPDVDVLAHPECSPEVVERSDFSGSTSGLIRAVRERGPGPYLLLTECSMTDNIAGQSPGKEMVRLSRVPCPHMKEVTLESVRAALLHDRYEVDVPEPVRSAARKPIERMLETCAQRH